MMKRFLLFLVVIQALSVGERTIGQALFVPGGTNGITSSSNSSIGIGISTPQAKLHITTDNQDNLGLIIHGNSINQDFQQHYVGLALDGDYGNGKGNSSQIRSYSNLYTNWGSSLTFHTTAAGVANTLIERLRIDQNGRVGIGISSPKAFLDVADYSTNSLKTVLARLSEGNNNGEGTFLGVRAYDTQGATVDGSINSFAIEHKFYDHINSSINFYRGGDVLGGFITFSTSNNSEKMRIRANGNVLIGKTAQTQSEVNFKLDVAGPIRANEIVVNTSGADFVFEPTYKLRSLSELEAFIKANKHLPDIAPAKEMQENGVSAGEMQAKLLQKVEEVTLYLIEQSKQIESLKKENELLKQVNKTNTDLLLKEINELKIKLQQ